MNEVQYGALYIIYMFCSCIGGTALINAAISWRNLGTRRGRIQAFCGFVLLASSIGMVLYAASQNEGSHQ